jgi:hypothetical protein
VAGLLLILWETFETIVLPRRVARRLRLTRLFYRSTWIPWSAVARALTGQRREAFLAVCQQHQEGAMTFRSPRRRDEALGR